MNNYSGLNPNYLDENLVATVSIDDFKVEDADTIFATIGNREVQLRLAGIDAPEITHEDQPNKIAALAEQPYGREATKRLQEILSNQNKIKILFNPEANDAYGRTPAVLIGDDGVNINLQLVKEGVAAVLPFGKTKDRLIDTKEFLRSQEEAFSSELGMWAHKGWRAVNEGQIGSKNRITHNTFTDLNKLYENFSASSLVHRLRNSDSALSSVLSGGERTDYAIIEGMKHGWFGSSRQANLEDFSSPYVIDKVVPKIQHSNKTKMMLVEGNRTARSWSKKMFDHDSWIKHYKGN